MAGGGQFEAKNTFHHNGYEMKSNIYTFGIPTADYTACTGVQHVLSYAEEVSWCPLVMKFLKVHTAAAVGDTRCPFTR